VIVKCGAEGAAWSDGSQIVRVAADPITAVDSTGAGDAFAAGVLAAVLAGDDIEAALAAGNHLAAAAITKAGARP
jgi:sugar/nucleoside kinase (ribokinase family)